MSNKIKPIRRHKARANALKALYEWHLAGNDIVDIEDHYLKNLANQPYIDIEYFLHLLHEVPKTCNELDELIQSHIDRPLVDLEPIEFAALRLGTYELVHCLEVPYRVVINEATELTKSFGSQDGYKYVNGVLDKIAAKVRAAEKQAN